MTILDTLAEGARRRVEEAKQAIPQEEMRRQAEAMVHGDGSFPFEQALRGGDIAFICEIKKASPSRGVIAPDFPYLEIARAYEAAGAAAVSVLTEPDYFLGNDRYLSEIRREIRLPLLRKDFVVDPYQIYQAKALGADAVLLIAALLDTPVIREYLDICRCLRLSALVEAHTRAELSSAVDAGAGIIGVNNRNLHTFEVSVDTCLALRDLAPPGALFVAESGIRDAHDVERMRLAGADAVLVGEALMRSADKAEALAKLKGGAPLCRA